LEAALLALVPLAVELPTQALYSDLAPAPVEVRDQPSSFALLFQKFLGLVRRCVASIRYL
jgi:hypothetical protein